MTFILPTTPIPALDEDTIDSMDTMVESGSDLSVITSTEVILPAAMDDEPDTIELPSLSVSRCY